MEEALEATLEPIIIRLLSEAYNNLYAEYNVLHDLPEDSFISKSEDLVKTLALQEEETFLLNGIFTFEEVNPAMSYPVLNSLPKGTQLARIKPVEKLSEPIPLND